VGLRSASALAVTPNARDAQVRRDIAKMFIRRSSHSPAAIVHLPETSASASAEIGHSTGQSGVTEFSHFNRARSTVHAPPHMCSESGTLHVAPVRILRAV
jgi:hypothetical protein